MFLNSDIFLTHGPDEISAAMFFKIITGTTGLLTAPIPARMGSGVVTEGGIRAKPLL